MTNDRALEVALDVLHQVRRGQRPFLPYTEAVEVINALEDVRSQASRVDAVSTQST